MSGAEKESVRGGTALFQVRSARDNNLRRAARSPSGQLCLPPWGPHVRFRQVQTLVREGSLLVKRRNSA